MQAHLARSNEIPPNILISDLRPRRFLTVADLTERWKVKSLVVTVTRFTWEKTVPVPSDIDPLTRQPREKLAAAMWFILPFEADEFDRPMLIAADENQGALKAAIKGITIGDAIGKRVTITIGTHKKKQVLRISPTPPPAADAERIAENGGTVHSQPEQAATTTTNGAVISPTPESTAATGGTGQTQPKPARKPLPPLPRGPLVVTPQGVSADTPAGLRDIPGVTAANGDASEAGTTAAASSRTVVLKERPIVAVYRKMIKRDASTAFWCLANNCKNLPREKAMQIIADQGGDLAKAFEVVAKDYASDPVKA